MNMFFWLLVILSLILLWFILSFSFRWIGNGAMRLYDDAVENMKDPEESNESKEKENIEG